MSASVPAMPAPSSPTRPAGNSTTTAPLSRTLTLLLNENYFIVIGFGGDGDDSGIGALNKFPTVATFTDRNLPSAVVLLAMFHFPPFVPSILRQTHPIGLESGTRFLGQIFIIEVEARCITFALPLVAAPKRVKKWVVHCLSRPASMSAN